MGLLDNKVAFITGGASGIGASTVQRFAEEGASVVVADLLDEEGQAVCRAITEAGGKALFLKCDVSDATSVKNAIDTTIEQFGKLDIVFANAGINGVMAPIEEIQPDEWDKTINTNLRGTYLTIHFAVPYLKQNGGGSIVITSSVNGTRTFTNPGASAYSASKAAQIGLMKMLTLELGRHNIRCNAICPGAISTNIDDRSEYRNVEQIGVRISTPQGNPVLNKGWGEPSHVADACLYLVSDAGRHISGIEIFVDGGASLL